MKSNIQLNLKEVLKKQLILSVFLCFAVNFMYSQSYVGHSIDNYSGVHGIIYNPSSVVGSKVRADINLVSASFFGGSDYFGINVGDIINGDGEFDFDEDAERFTSNNNNFFVNVDVLGPSFMFNLSPRSSIGITSRVRAFVNINNINGELFESFEDGFDTDKDFDFSSENLSANIHAWGEVGLTYGRILIDRPHHVLKGGFTLKYLQGAGSIFVSSRGLEGQYDSNAETISTTGELSYGTSRDLDDNNDDIDFSDLSAGFGADIGFTYEWHPNRENNGEPSYKDSYRLKVGVSVTDIGSINYEDAIVNDYSLDVDNVDVSDIEDVEEFLDENYSSTETREATKIQLPTALHAMVDYRLAKKWYVSAQADFSLTDDNSELGSRIINTIVIAPRLETKWFSLYAPLSFREYGDTSFGAGLRFGPLTVGSGSAITNLISDSSKTTDVFFGLKIPLYRK